MILRSHEKPDYHEFLFSKKREQIILPEVYLKIIDYHINSEIKPYNILDFGCGAGYVSLLIGEHLKEIPDVHIYSLDYQEDLLDQFWKKIVQKELKNVTPFHLNEQNRIFYPKWLPDIDLAFFSFSLSASSGPDDILETTGRIIIPGGRIFIFDWSSDFNNLTLDELFPQENRLTPMIFEQIIERSGYYLDKDKEKYKISNQEGYFFLEAFKPNQNESSNG